MDSRYCTLRCGRQSRHAARKAKLGPRSCAFCGTTFRPAFSTTRHCSRACGRKAAWHAEIDARYEAQVDRSAGPEACHPWTGTVNGDGYGRFGNTSAHRWAYARYVGELKEGEVVRHGCDNPPCQNRGHLTAGTQTDNIRDRTERNRSARLLGERGPTARLTEQDVLAIRASGASAKQLAAQYGVARSTIGAVLHRETWKHI